MPEELLRVWRGAAPRTTLKEGSTARPPDSELQGCPIPHGGGVAFSEHGASCGGRADLGLRASASPSIGN